MNIYTVTPHFIQAIRGLFPGHTVKILPEDYTGIVADLVIFTGGEDINCKLYGKESRKMRENPRDKWELKVLRDIRTRKLVTTKVLGICRGHQLLNVGFGGTLIFDIEESVGKAHSYIHGIKWLIPNIFSRGMDVVNSMHHQAVEYCGDSYPYKILGMEPATSTIEAIVWADTYLGVQFHPEFFPESPAKKAFTDNILKWIKGTPIVETEPVLKKYVTSSSTKVNFADFTTFQAFDTEE